MTADRSSPARTPWAILGALIAFALLAWKLEFLCDDAYISFRYSKNFAAGEGLRYNLTLGEPVEGYSNFLWVVWLALFEKLGIDITVAARVSSLACGALLLIWVVRHATRSLQLSFAGSLATGLFLATLPAFALWSTGGLATMPAALFIFGVYVYLLGDPERPRGMQAGLCAGLAGLVRADGTVWVLMLLGAAGVLWFFSGRRRELLRASVTCAVLLVLIVGAHVAWRYSYYGDYLPNTARVKAGFSWHRLARGFDYIMAYLLTLPAISMVLLFSLRRWRSGLAHVWWPAAAVISLTLGYGLWVGGDFMPMGRFLFPAVPFIALLAAACWSHYAPENGRPRPLWIGLGLVAISSSVLACFDVNLMPDSVRSRFHFRQDRAWQSELEMRAGMDQRAHEWSIQGRALCRIIKPGETVSAGAIGAMGYYSGLEIYDDYGLVTPIVIEAAQPREQSSPGHDVRVGTMFFLKLKPTYMGSLLAPSNSELGYAITKEATTASWESNPLSKLVHVERYPLIESDGGQPGWELRLLRYHRWQ